MSGYFCQGRYRITLAARGLAVNLEQEVAKVANRSASNFEGEPKPYSLDQPE